VHTTSLEVIGTHVKRTLAALALTSATTLTLGAVPAQAAKGVLVINGTEFHNPVGCFDTDRWPLVVDNRTDGPGYVFSDPGCTGNFVMVVEEGRRETSEIGQSVYLR